MADDEKNKPTETDMCAEDFGKPSSDELPKKIGPYLLLEQIGEGGMGIVYLAEQTEPVRRRVALKIIKPGMDSKQVLARFEAERQALAMMDNPNVAKVFDAGVTPPEMGSLSYFVMEHVAGISITEHCDRQRLSIDQRLELFMQVCQAVQHVHQNGIIHRDIKPTNVLVSVEGGEPTVKVLDFGIAKAISQRLTEQTLYTEQGHAISTPVYMSPEQADMSSLNVDTRTDIYSLGVLLYELLVGALPFDPKTLRKATIGEILRIICEQEPPKPSTSLSRLGDASSASALARRVDPRSLERKLRGDLDWIVMKAMDKDRARRYQSAGELASDIKRHLTNEPILAGAPNAMYRLGKFWRRHHVAAASTVAIVLASTVGMVQIGVGYNKTARERDRAMVFGQSIAISLTEAEEKIESVKLALRLYQAAVAVQEGTIGADSLMTLLNEMSRSPGLQEKAQIYIECLHDNSNWDDSRLADLAVNIAKAASKHYCTITVTTYPKPGAEIRYAKSVDASATTMKAMGRSRTDPKEIERALYKFESWRKEKSTGRKKKTGEVNRFDCTEDTADVEITEG